MLDKNVVTEKAFKMVGESFLSFNDNKADLFNIGLQLLEGLIEDVTVDVNLLFNAKKTKFNLNSEKDGLYYYNLPPDFMSFIKASDRKATLMGEFLISSTEDIEVTYCYKLPFSEFPNYMGRYMTLLVAKELTSALTTYQAYKQIIDLELAKEKVKIYNSEGLIF